MSRTIMIVDDEAMITNTLSNLVRLFLKHNVLTFNNPTDALESDNLNSGEVDLIISDFMMPGMNGLEFLKKAKEKSPDLITVMLTGYADKENAIKSINEVGLYYYIEKPWDNNALLKIVQNGLEKKEMKETLIKNFEEIKKSRQEIERLYDLLQKDYNEHLENSKSLIVTLANVIEAKDAYTDGHTRRVGSICKAIGERMGLPREQINNLEMAGVIHDIGKVGVSEAILNKPGKLSPEEFDVMKNHTVIGETILKPLGSLRDCLDAVRHHHEKLDGSGYPDGLKSSEISIEARILAVADIFDALYSDRPYRSRMPLDKAKRILREEADKGQLDMEIVEILFKLLDEGALNETIDSGTDLN